MAASRLRIPALIILLPAGFTAGALTANVNPERLLGPAFQPLLAAGQTAASVAIESGYVDQSHLHREVKTFTGLTPAAVAVAPWLAIDDVAWPASSPTRNSAKGGERVPGLH